MIQTVYIGLGSNLGDSQATLRRALDSVALLPDIADLSCSSFYASKAIGPPQPDYLNAVARFKTTLSPLDLLDALQQIELSHGRERLVHWGPRTLDLDILLIDDQIIEHPRLTVPHPYLTQRSFVVVPLAELAPELLLPSGEQLSVLAESIERDGLCKLSV